MTSDVLSEERAAAASSQPAAHELFTPGYRGYVMALLLAIYTLNFLDRQVINIVAEPIKRELHLADWQLGMMSGLAFAVLYTFLGIPVARLAERANRPVIIGAAVAVWSCFTALCGAAQNFWQLVLCRVGVGVGEAGCTPPAHSLIVDYAPPEKRSSLLAVYGLGSPLGALTGMAFGGMVADAYGWRTAFFLAGAPGLVFALLTFFTLKEPRRLLRRQAEQAKAASSSFWADLGVLLSKRTYVCVILATAIKSLIVTGQAPFIASFFLRNHTDGIAEAARWAGGVFGLQMKSVGFLGIALGLLLGLGGAFGMWGGGQLADRLGRRDPRWNMHIATVGAILTVPLFLGCLMAPSVGWSLGLLGVYAMMGSVHYGPAYTTIFSVVPAGMRATSSAVLLFISNLVGLALGPVLIGLTSDLFAAHVGEGEGLKWALMIAAMIGLVAAVFYEYAARKLKAEMLP